jgi:hypothetical protein
MLLGRSAGIVDLSMIFLLGKPHSQQLWGFLSGGPFRGNSSDLDESLDLALRHANGAP